MCTVVYRQGAGHLLLAMNRDERRGRASETPPTIHNGSPRWVAPADGAKGGTWIGVNDRGVAACLLNGYAKGDLALLTRTDIPSRGGIIPELLGLQWRDVEDWIRHGLDADRYPSFTLLVWVPGGGLRVRWRLDDGLGISPLPENAWGMESSSAWRTKDVLARRDLLFKRWLDAGAPFTARLPSFNLIDEHDRKQWSPFMTRSFSATRSLTVVEIDTLRGFAELAWWPRPGDGQITPEKPGACRRLDLATGEAA